MVRGFRRFMWALNFEKASSIGLKSGEYGGRNKSQAPRFSTARLALSRLCAGMNPVNPRTGKIGKRGEVFPGGRNFRLEATHLTV